MTGFMTSLVTAKEKRSDLVVSAALQNRLNKSWIKQVHLTQEINTKKIGWNSHSS